MPPTSNPQFLHLTPSIHAHLRCSDPQATPDAIGGPLGDTPAAPWARGHTLRGGLRRLTEGLLPRVRRTGGDHPRVGRMASSAPGCVIGEAYEAIHEENRSEDQCTRTYHRNLPDRHRSNTGDSQGNPRQNQADVLSSGHYLSPPRGVEYSTKGQEIGR